MSIAACNCDVTLADRDRKCRIDHNIQVILYYFVLNRPSSFVGIQNISRRKFRSVVYLLEMKADIDTNELAPLIDFRS